MMDRVTILGVSRASALRTRSTTLSSSTFGSPSQCLLQICHQRLLSHRISQIRRVAGSNIRDHLMCLFARIRQFCLTPLWQVLEGVLVTDVHKRLRSLGFGNFGCKFHGVSFNVFSIACHLSIKYRNSPFLTTSLFQSTNQLKHLWNRVLIG